MTSTADGPAAPTLRPKRRRWPFVAIGLLVVVIVGFFIADAAAKTYAEDRITRELVSSLGLASTTGVDVDLGGGSILLQALSGRVDTVDATIPKLAVGALVGSATLRATGVPLDTSKPLKTLAVTFRVKEGDLGALAKNFTELDLDSITLKKPDIVANASATVLGARIPLALGLTPSVSKGQLVFTPSTVAAAGATVSADDLRSNLLLGGLAKTLLTQRSFCVAEYLPRALIARSVQVTTSAVVLGFEGDGGVLGGSDFTTKGSCS